MGELFKDLMGAAKDLRAFAVTHPGMFMLLTLAVLGYAWARSRPGGGARLWSRSR